MGVFRLLLAWSVLLGHGGHGFFGLGFLHRDEAVQSFFVVSGFYMALVLNEKYTGPGRYVTFLQQRFLRLCPTYFILLFLILIMDGAISAWTGQPFGSFAAWAQVWEVIKPDAIFFCGFLNLVIFGQDMNEFCQIDTTGHLLFAINPLPHTIPSGMFLLNRPSWSLAVELTFYVVAPFLVCRSAGVQLSFLSASLVLRVIFHYFFGRESHWIYLFGPSNLYFFMAGSLGYLFYKKYRPRTEAFALNYPWIFWIFAAFLVTYTRLPFAHQLYLVFLPLVFLMVPLLFAATRTNRIDRLIGELSYPFYLIHMQVLYLWDLLFAKQATAIAGPACVAATMLLAYLFYRYIEIRTEHFREGLYKRRKEKIEAASRAPAFSPSPATAE